MSECLRVASCLCCLGYNRTEVYQVIRVLIGLHLTECEMTQRHTLLTQGGQVVPAKPISLGLPLHVWALAVWETDYGLTLESYPAPAPLGARE